MSTYDLEPVMKTNEFKCPKCDILVKIAINLLTDNSEAQTYWEGSEMTPKTRESQWYTFKCPHCEQKAVVPSDIVQSLKILPKTEQKKMKQNHIWLE